VDDYDALVDLLNQTNGDGANGDTMSTMGIQFWKKSVAAGHPMAQEPEGEGSDKAMNYQTMGWGEGTPYHEPPVVDRFKWLDSRFMMNVCDRWNQHKGKQPLQVGYFNGVGLETWENVWSCWVGLTEGDGEAIRRGGSILRYFGGRGFLQSPDWEPHVTTLQQGVHASIFPHPSGEETVWLLVNTGGKDVNGSMIQVAPPVGTKLYDCYHGTELTPVSEDLEGQALSSSSSSSLAAEWTEHDGYNCYEDHGATDLESPPGSSCGSMAVAECEAKCDSLSGCTSITVDTSEGGSKVGCYRRADVHITECDYSHKGGYNTYTKPALPTPPPPTPAPPMPTPAPGPAVTLSFEIEKDGIGCVVATANASSFFQSMRSSSSGGGGGGTARDKSESSTPSTTFGAFLAKMQAMTAKPLQCYDWSFKALEQKMVPIGATKSYGPQPPAQGTMAVIPATKAFTFTSHGLEIETTFGCDLQFPWESAPGTSHSHTLAIESFYSDKVSGFKHSRCFTASHFMHLDTPHL
jgi:hypothetical protein